MILAHRRPVPAGRSEANDLSVGTELVSITDGGRVDVLVAPAPGRSVARPIRSSDGRLAWYDLPAGKSTDLAYADVRLVVEDVPVPTTSAARANVWAEYDDRGGRGHAEWCDDGTGRIVEAHLVQRRLAWWPWPLRQAWRCVTVDTVTGRTVPAAADNSAEPSWHPTADLVWARAGGSTVHVPGLGLTLNAPGQAFDPYISPDASRIVVLVKARRFGLWLADPVTGAGRWLVDPGDASVEVSHARWDSDGSVVCSMKLLKTTGGTWGAPSAYYWRLVRVTLDGSRQWLTGPADGSVEQPFPVI